MDGATASGFPVRLDGFLASVDAVTSAGASVEAMFRGWFNGHGFFAKKKP